jgi:apolipoprotein D and lipocalin family protein
MRIRQALVLLLVAFAAGCAHAPPTIPSAPAVDLPRFMGRWYVVAHIPTYRERDAYNAVEHYALRDDGKVQTTYQHRSGSFDAPLETMRPVGHVRPGTGNAVWGMQFVWPIKAEYVIAFVDPGYTRTIIARSARDHAWVMARKPTMSDADYRDTLDRLQAMGYELDQVRRVPQRWPEPSGPRAASGR